MPAAVAKPQSSILPATYRVVTLDQLVEHPLNPRKHFDEAKLTELAASIALRGVLEPLVTREVPNQSLAAALRFEIVAGACRFRAAKRAGVATVPIVVGEYSDDELLELMLIENLHRNDLTPLEQAAAFRTLIRSNPGKHTAATIATKIGKSEAWVWDLLKLNDLVRPAQQLLEAGRISASHAIRIARQKHEDQLRIIDPDQGGLFEQEDAHLFHAAPAAAGKDRYAGLKTRTIRELEDWIADHIRFDVAHAAKAVPLQFQAVAEQVETAAAQPGRGKKVIAITYDHVTKLDARDDQERTYGVQSWHRADGQEQSKTCAHAVLGVVVAGSQHYGQAFPVCVARDKCEVHYGAVIKAKQQATTLRAQGQTAKARKVEQKAENQWQREQRQREERRRRWEILRPHAVAAVAAKIKPRPLTNAILQRALSQLVPDDRASEIRKLMGGPVTTKTFSRAVALAEVLKDSWSIDRFKPVAKQYRVDLKKLERSLAPVKVKKDGAE